MREVSELTDAILSAVESIPPGRVSSYGAVAAYVTDTFGKVGPRRVGNVMSEYGAAVPWYRVLRADLTSAPQVAARQSELLALEGVPMPRGRVPESYRHHF